jgi:hypothetical protein
MSGQRNDSNDDVMELNDHNSPPPAEDGEDGYAGQNGDRHRKAGVNRTSADSPLIQSPAVVGNAANMQAAVAAAAKWSAQIVYLRVMGRKPGPPNNELNLVKPYKIAPANYSLMGLFSKESSEVRIGHAL